MATRWTTASRKKWRDKLALQVANEREARGGACQECGSTDGLVWHHRDPAAKSFTIGNGRKAGGPYTLSLELAKCDLLCRSCHVAAHAQAPARLAAELG